MILWTFANLENPHFNSLPGKVAYQSSSKNVKDAVRLISL